MGSWSKYSATAVLVLASLSIRAQTEQTTQGNTGTWFLLFNRLNLNKNWSITNELHERTGKFLSEQGQFLWRPCFDYHWGEHVELSFGYTFIRFNSYEPYTLPLSRNENNIWTQVLLKDKFGKVSFQHRFRQENRWIDHFETVDDQTVIDGTDYLNRFRYRITISFDLLVFEHNQAIFANVFDEIWINQNQNLAFTDFARNWLYLGLGYRFNNNTNLQLGFLHQRDRTAPQTFIQTPIIQTSFFKNFDLTIK